MSDSNTVSPTPVAVIGAAASEINRMYSGIKLTIERQFAKLRAENIKAGAPVAVMDIWDKVASDFATALARGKRNCMSVVFAELEARSGREAMRPHAERAAQLFVDAGFNAEAHIDNWWDRDSGSISYRVVVHIGLR